MTTDGSNRSVGHMNRMIRASRQSARRTVSERKAHPLVVVMLANELTDSRMDPVVLLLAVSRSLTLGPGDGTIFENDTPACRVLPLGSGMRCVCDLNTRIQSERSPTAATEIQVACSQPSAASELRSSVTCDPTLLCPGTLLSVASPALVVCVLSELRCWDINDHSEAEQNCMSDHVA